MATEKLEIVIEADDRTSGALNTLQIAAGNLAANLLSSGIGVALDGLRAGFDLLGDAVGLAMTEAMEAEENLAQLEAVIESTGGAAGISAEEATALADGLSEVTRFSDDAVLAAENVLLTFTNIGEEVFPAALTAALDLSTAMDQDLQTSIVQIGKAINDPVTGMTALQRVGVTFSEAQKEMIKSLVESGQKMEAQKIILQELTREFGGSAEAAGETFAGKLDILKNSLNNVAEEIGMAVLPSVKELADQLLEFVRSDEFQGWVEKAAEWLRTELPKAIETTVAFWENELQPTLEELVPILRDDLIPALDALARLLGPTLGPILVLSARAVVFWGQAVDFALAPIRGMIEGIRVLKQELQNLLTLWGIGGGGAGLPALSLPSLGTAGAASAFGGGSGGGNVTNVTVNAGSVLSFADEQGLEMALADLVRRWVQ